MKINTTYFAKEALISFKRNLVQSIAAITTVALCLIVVGLILLLMVVGGEIIKLIEKKVEIEVFLEGTEAELAELGSNTVGRWDRIEQLGDTIRSWPEVKKAKFISKENALREFRKKFAENPEIVNQMEGNPLPASYRITLENPRQVERVANRIKKISYINTLVGDTEENIKYGKETVERLFNVTRWISVIAAAFAALLIFVSLVLITNTIRLAIFARRKEIGIMRLVGASSWFVRWPFILEGMFEGIIGAIIAIAVLTGLWQTVFANLAAGRLLVFLPDFRVDNNSFYQLVLLLAASGTLIGALGSVIALRRFLKV